MTGAVPTDRTAKRIAGAGSLIAVALAVYWLIEVLRKQVPEFGATVYLDIYFWSVAALCFGRVAMGRDRSGRGTNFLFVFTTQSALWAALLVLKWSEHPTPGFGSKVFASCAVAVGLLGASIFVVMRRYRGAAQPGVEPAGASGRGSTP
jgi:hypothetical protein